MWQTRRVQGSVSIFLALTITMMLSLCMVFINSARENAMLLKADIVANTAARSVMAEYHKKLWEDYDLFYLDCSYGTDTPDYATVLQHLQSYIEANLQYDQHTWFALQYEGAKMSETKLATDHQGSLFYLQAVHAVETSIGVSYVEQILAWFEKIDTIIQQEDKITETDAQVTETLDQVNGTTVEIKEAVWGTDQNGEPILIEEAEYETVDIHNPLDDILSGNLLLKKIIGDTSTISSERIQLQSLASHRRLAAGTGENQEDVDGIWKKALFCKYVLTHFQHYGNVQEEQEGLQYPLEYLIGGKASDNLNLEVVTMELLAIREIDNYISLLQNEEKRLQADAIAAAAASLVPWAAPAISQATLLYWAYEDSVEELQKLLEGEKIPLLRSLGLEDNILLGYEEYLYLLLLLQNRETITMRAIDMIEMDIRKEEAHFRMDACINDAAFMAVFTDIYEKYYMTDQNINYFISKK